MRSLYIIFLYVVLCPVAFAQIPFNNPSFEDACANCGGAASGWTVCTPSPDVLPGCFGVNGAAQDGSTYAGFCTSETIGQTLNQSLMKGSPYSFSVYLRYDAGYGSSSAGTGTCSSAPSDGARGQAGQLQIWGGATPCSQDELLYQSPTLTKQTWTQFTINFTPKNGNYNYIMLVQPLSGLGTGANICVDNLSMIQFVPIKLISFSGARMGEDVLLKWETATEKNNEKFIIEKSTDGIEYYELGTIAGAINSSTVNRYQWLDRTGNGMTQYYRLKQQDLDKNISCSQAITVSFAPDFSGKLKVEYLYVEPNNKNSLFYKTLTGSGGPFTVHVLNITGQELLRTTINPALDGNEALNISGMPAGSYFFYLNNENGPSEVMRFIK